LLLLTESRAVHAGIASVIIFEVGEAENPANEIKNKVQHVKKSLCNLQMIPKIIHVFWKGKHCEFVEACIARMRSMHPSWTLIRYSDFEEADHVHGFDKLAVQAKTDWLRVCLIAKYGGVWLDASIICNGCIEESFDLTESRVVGFETPFGKGIMENWAFGARPQHPLIIAWKDEFRRAIELGFEVYKQQSGLEDHPIYERMPYLTQHASYVKIVNTYADMVVLHHSLDPTHGPFFFTKSEWETKKHRGAVSKLFLRDFRLPPLIKFTGETRGYVAQMLLYVHVRPNSFMRRTLHLCNSRRVMITTCLLILACIMSMLLLARSLHRFCSKGVEKVN